MYLSAFRPELNVDRQLQVVVIFLKRAASDELAATRADDQVVRRKLGHAGAVDPTCKEVAHVLTGNAGRQLFKIVDRGVLAAVLLDELAKQLVELLSSERVAQKLKDKRSFAVHDVLIGRRLVVEIARRASERSSLFERQRFFQKLAPQVVEFWTVHRTFAISESTVLGQAL